MLHAKRRSKNHENETLSSPLPMLWQWTLPCRDIISSSDDNNQSLATYTKRKQLSTSKNDTTKGRSGSPSHTHTPYTLHSDTLQRVLKPSLQIQSKFPMSEDSYADRKYKGKEMAKLLPGLHCKIFAQFYHRTNTISPFSVLTRLPSFFHSKSKDAQKSILHTSLENERLVFNQG